MGWDTRRPASGFSYFLIFSEGRQDAVRGGNGARPGHQGTIAAPIPRQTGERTIDGPIEAKLDPAEYGPEGEWVLLQPARR